VRYTFFPGCSLESTAGEFNSSVRAVFNALEIDLEELPGWVCCGSTPAHGSSPSLALALPAFNLKKAEAVGTPVLAACASCYSRLRTANHRIREAPEEREKAERLLGTDYDGRVEVVHILDALANRFGRERLAEKVTTPLKGLRPACYYGCLLTRPPDVAAFEDPEHPVSMDELLSAAGADVVDWPYKTECCGAGLSVTNSAVACRLGHRLLSMALEGGANCIVVACPLCQANLDLRQEDAGKMYGKLEKMPVFYVTQLLGLALGAPRDLLGFESLAVDPRSLLEGMDDRG
jgi:heterodisulfide reductase subunit B2